MSLSARGPAFAALGAAGLIVGLATSEPAAVALGAAFLVPLLYGLATGAPRLPEVGTGLSVERLVEGGSLETRLTLVAPDDLGWVEVRLVHPPGVRPTGVTGRVLGLRRGETRTLEHSLHCPRWGVYELGRAEVRTSDGLGMLTAKTDTGAAPQVRVYPRLERLRRLARPRATRPATGNTPARAIGDGIEFAEVRELRPGERARRINQRASSRHRRLLVDDRLPERSNDIVVFLDSLTHWGTHEHTTLDDAVRAAAALTHAYLRERDRVGLLGFGGDLEWVLPGTGSRQQYRIVEAVLASEAARLYRWNDLSLIPRQILPPQSLIVAISPLLDWRVNRALLNLCARGYNVALVEIDPVPFARRLRSYYGDTAWRLWLLERDRVRSRFARSGARLASWNPDQPLATSVEQLAWAR